MCPPPQAMSGCCTRTPCTAPVCFLLPWHGHALCTYLLPLAGSIAACSLCPSSISPCSAKDESTGQFCSRKAGKQEGIGTHINKRQPETQKRCNLTLTPSIFLKENFSSTTSPSGTQCSVKQAVNRPCAFFTILSLFLLLLCSSYAPLY